jgi:hypothetical protein
LVNKFFPIKLLLNNVCDCGNESTLFYCPIKTCNYFFLTHNGRSPCSLGASKVQPPFKNCSQISTLPEYAAQCKLVFSSCKQRYPKLNAEILTHHNSQLLIILLPINVLKFLSTRIISIFTVKQHTYILNYVTIYLYS